MRRILVFGAALLALTFLSVSVVWAHANLLRSEPAPNAVLLTAPDEIRLWFSEPLEPDFSRITLRDANGETLELPPSQLEPSDPFQMFIEPGALTDGLYTVAWRVLSSADGHETRGSFPLTIGAAVAGAGISTEIEDEFPVDGALIRGFNLLSMALAVGGAGFWLFVWRPALPDGHPTIDARLRLLTWVGWGLLGIASVLWLLLQVSIAADIPVLAAASSPAFARIVSDSRFGDLWLARMGLWLAMGIALYVGKYRHRAWPFALLFGAAILLTTSLFSHASAAPDAPAAVAADWLHLLATALWVGGLVQFVVALASLRMSDSSNAPALSSLVGYFSNFARVGVAVLIVTGLYAAWLHVGSIEGLLTTLYGQALIVKLLLIFPLLLIALVNFAFTQRGLSEGRMVWGKRLRGLVGAEVALTFGVLAAVGVMTSTAGSRHVLALRESNAAVPQVAPYFDSFFLEAEQLHVDLEISPGTVGENTFNVALYDHLGVPIEDASLIRLRFENESAGIDESELRPEHQSGGIYTVSGANLSVPGVWRIRTTVQRPDAYDTVVDFTPEVALSAPYIPPTLDITPPLMARQTALLITGLAALMFGGFFFGQTGIHLRSGGGLLATGLLVLGSAFLGMGGALSSAPTEAAQAAVISEPALVSADVPDFPDSAAVTLAPSRNRGLPYLVTQGGAILKPDAAGAWDVLPLDAHVNDLFVDFDGSLWAATDSGTYRLRIDSSEWKLADPVPSDSMISTHGYMFMLGAGEISRGDPIHPDHWRLLDVPYIDQPAADLVMLGTHTHVLQNGGALFHSPDLGLGWRPLDADGAVSAIWTDIDGNLLAATSDGIDLWDRITNDWRDYAPLPDGQIVSELRTFNDRLFAVSEGYLYRYASGTWMLVGLPESTDAYLTALEVQYPDTLWALDAVRSRLWSSTDGSTWTLHRVPIG